MATFGKLTNGSASTSLSTDNVVVSTATPSSTGTVASLTARLKLSGEGTGKMKGVIYSDVAGAPTALLAVTDEQTFTNTSEAEVTATFSTPYSILSGVAYWIGIHWEDPGGGVTIDISRADDASGRIVGNGDTYAGGTATTFPTPGNTFNGPLDVYVTYTEAQRKNAADVGIKVNADGFEISGGATPRKLTVTGADVEITGSGDAEFQYPTESSTLATTELAEIFKNKEYQLGNTSGSLTTDLTFSGVTVIGTMAAATAFGQLVYFDFATAKWVIADANVSTTTGTRQLGICVVATNDVDQASKVLRYGLVRNDSWNFSAGQLFASTNAGDMTNTAPSGADNIVRVVGHAYSADIVFFNPSPDYIQHV